VVLEVDMLDEEEAAFHPFVGHRSMPASRDLLHADQPVQTLEVGVGLGLLVSLSVVGVIVRDGGFSLRQVAFCGRYNG
jgi:hypothetical protein